MTSPESSQEKNILDFFPENDAPRYSRNVADRGLVIFLKAITHVTEEILSLWSTLDESVSTSRRRIKTWSYEKSPCHSKVDQILTLSRMYNINQIFNYSRNTFVSAFVLNIIIID